MARWILICLALRIATAAVRTLPERIAVGECVDSTVGNVSLYPSKISTFPDPAVTAAEADATAAALISVAYGNHFKVLSEELSKEQYVLTQCGTPQPTDEEINAIVSGTGYQRKHFSVPVQRVTAASTTILSFLRRLGVEDRVAYTDAYAVHGCWQKAASCGSTLEPAWNGNATKREEQLNDVEVVFMDCNTDCSNVRARSNAVHVPATKDNGNLHSAEYIKFLAAFFNLEELALLTFLDTVASYTSRLAAASPLVVAWIQWNGYYSRYELSQASYKLQLVTAGGGRNVDAAQLVLSGASLVAEDAVAGNPAAGKTYYVPGDDRAVAANALMAAIEDVDIVVDETYAPDPGAYNYSSFLANFYLTAQSTQKFLTAQKVLRVDRIYNSLGGLDWMESRIASPDWAATGLAHHILDDPSLQRSYFRNVAEGEAPELVTAESCSQSLPSCDASYATPIDVGINTATSQSIQWVPALLGPLALWAL